MHEDSYTHLGQSVTFFDNKDEYSELSCPMTIYVFPVGSFAKQFQTDEPLLSAVFVVFIFAFTSCVFAVYDCFVSRRQVITEQKAKKSTAIVQELFPGDTAAMLFESEPEPTPRRSAAGTAASVSETGSSTNLSMIAELHPASTVLCT